MSKPLYVGFYAPWDESSTASLQRHIGDLDWLAPVWVTVTGPNHQFTVLPDRNGRAVINVRGASAADPSGRAEFRQRAGRSSRRSGRCLPTRARGVTSSISSKCFLAANHASGAVFDFEELDARGQFNYLQLLREARARFIKRGWLVTVAVPVGEPWNLRAFAALADKLFVMAYDEHSNDGPPGPIASQQWWATEVAAAVRQIPRDKVIVTIGNYAYDWHDGGGDPENVEEAWVDAATAMRRRFSTASPANSTFAYDDENGHDAHGLAARCR